MRQSVFDTLADEYWEQFCQDMPVGGGMAYQNRLKDCVLDDTLESLKRLDKLLIAIKKDLSDKAYKESDLLKQTSFRNFIFFVAFYVGRVIQKLADTADGWQANLNVGKIAPQDKFYTLTAFGSSPIYVLMTIGAKLFGGLSRPFYHPTKHELIEDSVYWLAYDFIKSKSAIKTSSSSNADTVQIAHPQTNANPINPPSTALTQKQLTAIHINSPPKKPDLLQSSSNLQPTADVIGKSYQSQAFESKQNTKQTAYRTKNNKPKKHIDFFGELKNDLMTLPAANNTSQDDFVKAYEFLQKLSKIEDELTQKQQTNQLSAVKLLANTAKKGNTSAMLMLAVCYFEGVGVSKDETKGFGVVKKAAEAYDVRAQKLLSRLYYQGLGVASNIELGELWLQKAADNGHPEAKKLAAQFTQNKLLQDDFRVEAQKDRRYFTILIVVAVFGVLGLWFTGKLLA